MVSSKLPITFDLLLVPTGFSFKYYVVIVPCHCMPLLHRFVEFHITYVAPSPGFTNFVIEMKMGSTFNKAIFEDNVQASLLGWANKVKKKKALKKAAELTAEIATEPTPSEVLIQVESDGSSPKEDDWKQK